MKVTQEKREKSQIGLQIEIAGDVTTQYYDQKLNELSRTANIPGFRKGKVPRQIILQRMGQKGVKAVTVEALLEKMLPEAIKQEKIQAIGNYQIISDYEQLVDNFLLTLLS